MQHTNTHAYKHTSLQNEWKRNVAGFSLSYASNWNSDISQRQHRAADVDAAPTRWLSHSPSHTPECGRWRCLSRERETERAQRSAVEGVCLYVCVHVFWTSLRALSLSLSLCWPLVAFGFWFRSRLLLPCIPIALWEWKERVKQLGNSWELGQDVLSYFFTPLL